MEPPSIREFFCGLKPYLDVAKPTSEYKRVNDPYPQRFHFFSKFDFLLRMFWSSVTQVTGVGERVASEVFSFKAIFNMTDTLTLKYCIHRVVQYIKIFLDQLPIHMKNANLQYKELTETGMP